MIEDTVDRGLLVPGKEIVEPTSGSMGIPLAFVAAARRIPLTLAMPETISLERCRLDGTGIETGFNGRCSRYK